MALRDADKVAVAHDLHALELIGGAHVERCELGVVAARPQHFAMEHSGPRDVGRVTMGASDDIGSGCIGDRRSEDLPLVNARDCSLAGNGGRPFGVEGIAGGKFGERQTLVGVGDSEGALGERHGVAVRAKTRRREREQDLARLGRAATHAGNGRRRCSAARGTAVVGTQLGVGHDELDMLQWNVKLLSDGLCYLCARPLADFDLAGEGRDLAIGADVKTPRGRHGPLAASTTSTSAALLGTRLGGRYGHDEPRPEHLHKLAAIGVEPIRGRLALFVALDLGWLAIDVFSWHGIHCAPPAACSTAARMFS
jgi:hypothetical protein